MWDRKVIPSKCSKFLIVSWEVFIFLIIYITLQFFLICQVYLVRFMVTEQFADEYPDSPQVSDPKDMVFSEPINVRKEPVIEETCYPTSVSIDLLLKGGQLIKP